MITSKITQKMEERFLKLLYQRYTREYGYGTRNLAAYRVIVTGAAQFEDEMPEIVEYDSSQNLKRYLLVDILDELIKKGYVECSPDHIYYWLSERGYRSASQTKAQRLLSYLNNNAGLLASLSLIVSVIAMFIGA